MKCSKCGKEIANDSVFCEYCGEKINLVTIKEKNQKYQKLFWISLVVIVCLAILGIVLYYGYEQLEKQHEVQVAQARTEIESSLKKEAEERRIKSEELARKRKELLSIGYVDLGLPSGTVWKRTNEDGYYTFNEAKQRFGSNLPTKKQWDELISYCKWEWSGWKNNNEDEGYYVKGKNGASMFLPNLGEKVASRNYGRYGYGQQGCYWSSTISEKGACGFSSYRTYCDDHTKEEDKINTYEAWNDEDGYSVRLAY